MTSAATIFCCVIALALFQGFGAAAFTSVVAADAMSATLPFLGLLVVARFLEKRFPARARVVRRVHVVLQATLAGMAHGWWWVEPHALLTSLTGGSLAAMGWEALFGAAVGLVVALAAERGANPVVMREVGLGTWVMFLIAGGRIYRGFDHVEAGFRLETGAWITGGFVLLAVAAYLFLRHRERLATAIPALAPAVACAALLVASRSGGPSLPSSRDSILLVVVDTLRADIADGGMGSDVHGMPELARIASSGVRFTQAVSPAPWTLPATISLLSGWNPHRHGFGVTSSEWEVQRGNDAALYLAPAMRDAGYLTAGFVNNPYLRPWFGIGAGFYTLRPYHGRALDGVAVALEWLHDHEGTPSFALLHLMDPHWPYEAPAGFGAERKPCATCDSLLFAQFGVTGIGEREELRNRYAAEVRYTDAMLGRFYDTLVASGALEHTWLVFTADHGEEFWEHGGFLHGHSLHDELLRVPLVIVPPRALTDVKRNLRINTQVRLEDVAATMLDIAGIDARLAPDGATLRPLMQGVPDSAVRVEVSGFVKAPGDLSYAVRHPPWKAEASPGEPAKNHLFRLDQDPGEIHDLLAGPRRSEEESTALSRQFLALLAEPTRFGLVVTRERAHASSMVPDSDTQRALRSLGYVN